MTYFTGVLWPDFSINHLLAGVFWYQRHQRRVKELKLTLSTTTKSCKAEEQRVQDFLAWLESSQN